LAALGLFFSMAPLCGGVAHGLLWLAALPCEFIINLLNFVAGLGLFSEPTFVEPLPSILLAFAVLILVLFQFRGREKGTRGQKIFLLAVFPLLLLTPALRLTNVLDDELRLEALDVGQGQAILLSYRGIKILVDGGGSPPEEFDMGKNVLGPVLASNESPRADALINSHPDLDHLGGFFHILKTFKVGALFHNGQEADKRYASLWLDLRLKNYGVVLSEGDLIRVGAPARGVKLEVLHPPAEGNFKGNDASLVLRLRRGGETLALLPGDAGPAALRRVAAEYPDLKTRVLVAAHHGSDKNFQEDFLQSASPEIALVSCGYDNIWNFPGETVKKWFADRRVPLLSTSALGRIRIGFRPDGTLAVWTALGAKDKSE
ncbi:MAG: MBL fold metallo-hydrolase, partial [Desulfovibrio sp.]|nr:MBL fold metallo-hydrolase [Desulfovibrio sp.]